MITLILGAGASLSAGYPIVRGLFDHWHAHAVNPTALLESYSRLGFLAQVKEDCVRAIRKGISLLASNQCSTPDEFATRYPEKRQEIADLKKGLAALLVHFDCQADVSEYKTMWANILSRQFAQGADRTLGSILRKTKYRVITYNYDTAILRAAQDFLQEQFASEYQTEHGSDLTSALQLCEVPGIGFEPDRLSLLHVHGSFGFRVTQREAGGWASLAQDLAPGLNVDEILSDPVVHFPSEMDVGVSTAINSNSHYLDRYAKWVRDSILGSVAPATKVLVVVGFSFHIENWPFLLEFFTRAQVLNTVGLICPWTNNSNEVRPDSDKPLIESKIHMLLGEAGRHPAKVIWLGNNFSGLLNRPPGRDWLSILRQLQRAN